MLVEHFVGTGSPPRWTSEPEGLGHHAVDGQLVARRLLHHKICGPRSLEKLLREDDTAKVPRQRLALDEAEAPERLASTVNQLTGRSTRIWHTTDGLFFEAYWITSSALTNTE